MSLSETDVEKKLTDHLRALGWRIEQTHSTGYTDLIARRGDEVLVCELKGVTKSPETAVDIGYGQILRAMSRHPDASYALVVPEALLSKAQRVSKDVRRKLGLTVLVVPEAGEIYPDNA